MNVLGIDVSTSSGSVAILKDEGLIAEQTLNVKKTHSETILPSIKGILEESGLDFVDIDFFAVTIGPGSFTGLRVGLSTVKGLGWTLNKPVIGVSTLLALTCNARDSSLRVCPVMNARKNEVYTALFRVDGAKIVREMNDTVIKPELLIERLKGEVLFIGDGIKVYRKYLERYSKGITRFAHQALWNIRAYEVCRLALEAFRQGEGKRAEEMSIHYIRPSEAELKVLVL
ncbi:MAG: tRNA (adenosine(37)-N6)-threonylcarbamoyltransferase complex dimerization subunit type 1 TsaB [Thermodesulfobacteriota bacterium]